MDSSTRFGTESSSNILNSLIDYTCLKADATEEIIDQLCHTAKEREYHCVCVNPFWVKRAKNHGVAVCTVIGFPIGANLTQTKVQEAEQLILADELDMVMNIGAAKSGQWSVVFNEIECVVKASKKTVKVILETCLLNEKEIKRACQIAVEAGAAFVKTSTGFSTGGATEDAIRLMRESVPSGFGIKASGGIKTVEKAKALIAAGATRIGTSTPI